MWFLFPGPETRFSVLWFDTTWDKVYWRVKPLQKKYRKTNHFFFWSRPSMFMISQPPPYTYIRTYINVCVCVCVYVFMYVCINTGIERYRVAGRGSTGASSASELNAHTNLPYLRYLKILLSTLLREGGGGGSRSGGGGGSLSRGGGRNVNADGMTSTSCHGFGIY